jgi:DNA adenine methylase
VVQPPLPRPFLKWAGGKTQLLEELVGRLPPAVAGYHEPFAGSAALFFRLARDSRLRGAALADGNAELIDAYRAVRDGVEAVIGLLGAYPYDRDFYYSLRAQDPQALDLPARAARMIYLNKAGYNGLYRVNRRGQFNVPFGRYKNPRICDAGSLRAASAALQGVNLACATFETVLERARPGDLVYFDPPYAPLSATAHFTAYQAGGFSADDQRRLRDVCRGLAGRGVYVMLSNSDTELVRGLYAGPPFHLHQVWAGRAINSRALGRGKAPELIVTTYPA